MKTTSNSNTKIQIKNEIPNIHGYWTPFPDTRNNNRFAMSGVWWLFRMNRTNPVANIPKAKTFGEPLRETYLVLKIQRIKGVPTLLINMVGQKNSQPLFFAESPKYFFVKWVESGFLFQYQEDVKSAYCKQKIS